MKTGFSLALLSFITTLAIAFSPAGDNSTDAITGKIKVGSIPGGFQKVNKGAPSKRALPNIVFVISDDQDYHSLRAQKSLTRFFETGGRVYPNHFLTTPACCPSRESFFTGKYTHNHKVYSNRVFPFKNVDRPLGGAPLAGSKKQSIARVLQQRGYYTALIGKYLNGFTRRSIPPAGWSEIFSILGEESESPYYNYSARSKKKHFTFGDQPEDYSGRVLTKTALGAMLRAKKSRKPLFLQFSYPGPHLGSIDGHGPEPDPRDLGAWDKKFKNERCLYGAFNEKDVSDKPRGIQALPSITNIERMENICRLRWESLLSLERDFFSLVQKTKELGEFKNTVFIYTTDNGFFLGQHRIDKGKFLPYEESVRFPLFIKGPGVPSGKSMKMVENVDFYPTVLSLARSRGKSHDGSHLWRSPERKVVLLEHFVQSNPSPPYRALRTKRYLWVKYYTAAPPWRSVPSGEEELYDLYRDPYQTNNLAKRVTSPAWQKRLKALANCAGESCRVLSRKPLPALRFQALQGSNRTDQKSEQPVEGLPRLEVGQPKTPALSSR